MSPTSRRTPYSSLTCRTVSRDWPTTSSAAASIQRTAARNGACRCGDERLLGSNRSPPCTDSTFGKRCQRASAWPSGPVGTTKCVLITSKPGRRQRQAAHEAARQVREHGRKVRDRELAAKEHRHAHDVHALVVGFGGEVAGARGEHRHFVATRELARQRGHHDAAAAAQRRVFVVTKEDAHQSRTGASFVPVHGVVSGELRLRSNEFTGTPPVPSSALSHRTANRFQ